MTGLKLRFIKPCRETDSPPDLTVSRVIENKNRNTETALFLDLNILIRMEDVILKGGDPVELGLMSLVNFLNQCPPESVSLVPGLALTEVHPKFKKQCYELFEVFLSIFCPQMIAHPTATRNSEVEVEPNRKREFHELPIGEQYLHSISFYSLIQIHIINSRHSNCSGLEKFNHYMDAVCKDIDMLSAVEAEIAKYCFCTHKDIYSENLNEKIQAIKENFLDRHSNPKKHLANIFNGVQDLKYSKSALKFSEEMFYGKNQETWVVTLDSKLYWLSESIHHYPQQGEPDSKFFCIVRDRDQDNCEYWRSVDDALYKRLEARTQQGKSSVPLTDRHMKDLLNTLTRKGFDDFYEEFGT
ncbi:TPA: hypothetical protein ACN34I_004535 [Vibrio parahaemolyticus]